MNTTKCTKCKMPIDEHHKQGMIDGKPAHSNCVAEPKKELPDFWR